MPFRHSVAAQRNIDIIPEPCGEGNMPAAPELSDGKGEIRAFKVCHQINAEEPGTSDGDVGIP